MTAAEKDALRADRAALVRALKDAGAEFIRGGAVRCPFHADRHPSGSIFQTDDGVWRYRCHTVTCGVLADVIDVRARAAGKSSGDVMAELSAEQPGGSDEPPQKPKRVFPTVAAIRESVSAYTTVEDVYPYTNPATGKPDMLVIRCRGNDGRKSFLQASPRKEGDGYVMRGPGGLLPLFNRKGIAKAGQVVVVEGEKCVAALHAVGVCATTSPGGAENAAKADWSPLAGKIVVLWPDYDAAGERYIRDVAECLAKLPNPPTLHKIDAATLNLPEKGDAADLLDGLKGETAETRREVIDTIIGGASSVGPSAKVRRLIDDTISGKRRAIPWPWPLLGKLTNALMPGMVTVICGGGGTTKTYLLIQAARHWLRTDVPFALQELEEHEDGTHLLRALVQESGRGELLDLDWVKRNGQESRDIHGAYQTFLDRFGANLWAAPGSIPTLDDLTDWVRDRAKEGRRVIGIDPITAAETSDKPWADDKRFIRNTQTVMLDYGASLVLVTHPKQGRKSGGAPSMDDIAGGAAYQRHTQTVLWLNYLDEPRTVQAKTILAGNVAPVVPPPRINRTVTVHKATNGKGRGAQLGYWFGDGLEFSEMGIVVKERREEAA